MLFLKPYTRTDPKATPKATPESHPGCFEPIPPREVVSEDGDRISEWPVDLESVAQFVAA